AAEAVDRLRRLSDEVRGPDAYTVPHGAHHRARSRSRRPRCSEGKQWWSPAHHHDLVLPAGRVGPGVLRVAAVHDHQEVVARLVAVEEITNDPVEATPPLPPSWRNRSASAPSCRPCSRRPGTAAPAWARRSRARCTPTRLRAGRGAR